MEHERIALKGAQAIQNIIQTHQNIIEDLIILLENLISGEGIDLSGLDNIQIKNDLSILFSSLGIESNQEDIFLLKRDEFEKIKKAIKILIPSLKIRSPHELMTSSPSSSTLNTNQDINNNINN